MSSFAPSTGLVDVRDVLRAVGVIRITLFVHPSLGFTIRALQLLPPNGPEEPAAADLPENYEDLEESD